MIFIVNRVSGKLGIWGPEVNSSGIKRFTQSPMLAMLSRFKTLNTKFENYDPTTLVIDDFKNRKLYKNFIIPSGVTHSPWDWTGYTDLGKVYDPYAQKRKSVFAHINPKMLGALRKRRAYLLLDQSHEGYHTDWLFDWFHDCCNKYDVSPDRVIYVTGNLSVEKQYEAYCSNKNIQTKLFVVPHIQFEELIYDSAQKQVSVLPTLKDHLIYKSQNKIHLYNCFQKRARPHRIWMFYYLYKNNLLDDGLNSMNTFGNSFYEGKSISPEEQQELLKILPMYPRKGLNDFMKGEFEGPLGGQYERDLYHQETRDSWVSVVSEASYAENTCFISEKSFKPIAARHPFIMCGNKNSLTYLKELGYKTFEGFIDESYDSMNTWERYQAIIDNLLKIKSMSEKQKLDWYASMQDILEHNFETLKANTTRVLPSSVLKIQEYVGG